LILLSQVVAQDYFSVMLRSQTRFYAWRQRVILLPHEVEPPDPGWTPNRILLAIATVTILVVGFVVVLGTGQ